MKPSIILAASALGLAALYAPLAAAQTTPTFWEQTKGAPNVNGANTENSTFFSAPTTIGSSVKITGVSWNVPLYTNGATEQKHDVCYFQPYTTTPYKCVDVSNRLVANNASDFNGESAKGQISVRNKLTGGKYPVYPTHSYTIRVDYR